MGGGTRHGPGTGRAAGGGPFLPRQPHAAAANPGPAARRKRVIGKLRALLRDLSRPAGAGGGSRSGAAGHGGIAGGGRARGPSLQGGGARGAGHAADGAAGHRPGGCDGLVRRARVAVEKSVSLYEFTRPLHEALRTSRRRSSCACSGTSRSRTGTSTSTRIT